MTTLDQFLDRITDLPPAPRVAPRLLTLLAQPDIDGAHVVELIQCDPALTASVMRLCNSVMLGGATSVDSLPEAVLRLGFGQTYELVLAILAASTLSRAQKGYGLERGELWQHSLAAALCAKSMARDRGEDPHVVFTAALLHDLGKIVLAQALEGQYNQLMDQVQVHQFSMLEAEVKLLGVQHAEVGARLLARWSFPEHLVAAVCHHHDPAQAPLQPLLAAQVSLADMVAHFMGFGYGYESFALRGRAEALDLAGLTPQDLPRYMIQTYEQLETLRLLLRLQP